MKSKFVICLFFMRKVGISMNKNVGIIDRIIRIVIGVVLLSLLFLLDGNIRWIGLLGIVVIGTAAIGTCPLYFPFHINTKK